MTEQFTIRIETAKRLNAAQELLLAREAFDRNPASRLMRARLSGLFNLSDAFDQTIALLEGQDELSFSETMNLIQAYLALETGPANTAAGELARLAAEQSDEPQLRAAALAELAKAQVRQGQADARQTLIDALALDPANKNACKRLAAYFLARGEPEAVLSFTAALLDQGIGHSRLFAGRVLALAQTGRIAEAQALGGLRQLGHRTLLPVPEGFASLAEFNRELAGQLLAHPELRYERYGTASEATWRVDSPQSSHAPLVDLLLRTIGGEIERHIDGLAGIDHPWLRARPLAGKLHCWSVITDDAGYETWHVHQFGWMSGTYYVQIPERIAAGNGLGGCLAFGLPGDLVDAETAQAFGEDYLRPAPGLLSVFPSHTYHRTFPHNLAERRICVAFDLWPD